MKLQDIITSFVLGGSIVALVKWSASGLNDPMLAAIFGGIPVGLMSIYFLTSNDTSKDYAKNYFVTTSILLASIVFFYLLMSHSKLNKNVVATIALLLWLVINFARYFYLKKSRK